MKYFIHKILTIVCAMLMLVSCDELLIPAQSVVGDNVDVVIDFGASYQKQIEVRTRTTYDLYYESMVRNVYVLIFANDQKVYGRYFAAEDMNQTAAKEYWTVENMTSDNSSVQTKGTLHMNVPAISDNGEIVLIANMDLDFLNLSQERLGLILDKGDLEEMLVSLNQVIPDRNAGYFMMTGSEKGVSISKTGTISIPRGKITLERLDAKVNVNVRVNPNEPSDNQKVEAFTPKSWSVVNLPKTTYLVPNDGALELSSESFFDIAPRNFETTENEVVGGNATGGVLYGFSFYMLENNRSGEKKKSVNGNYHNRDRRNKYLDDINSDNYGKYNTENGLWEYAPELATYIVIKGELTMVVDPGLTTEQHLVADVTYIVHLGDFASDKDNYDVKRNTHYTYTINIRGVNSIEVEVETSNDNQDGITEDQPGAMGHLYEAEEDIYTFDAHYGQRVYTIKAQDIDVEHLTWYVRTPFGREGIPHKDVSGNELYNDLDYKWVEFMLNDKVAGSNLYSGMNMPYPADKSKLMSIIDVVNIIRTETIAWRNGEESMYDANGEMKMTVFVDEFYYTENPMNPNDNEVLWKKFVNQPNRLMHILCKNNRSADDDSSVTGSILTIRQRSIQTPYNIGLSNTELSEAWGCETEDETHNKAWFYHPNERMGTLSANHKPSYTPDNTSKTDGLYNTACLINLIKGTGSNKSLNTTLRWDTFIDYSESEIKLKDNYLAGLYSVFLRNRDLDGDGIVDPDELRWYIASLDQLCGLFIGDQGLSSEAQLYPITASREPNAPISGGPFNGVYPWRLHVVSSTAWNQTSGNSPTIVWAEEGASTGEYQVHYGKPAYSPVRFIRNLGMALPTTASISTAGANCPKDALIQVVRPTGTVNTNSVFRFDMRNINQESLRAYYTTHELVPGDEYTTLSRVYVGFETGELKHYTSQNPPYSILKAELESGGSPSPSGYRVPNVREGVIMHLYCSNDAAWWNNQGTLVSNFYSFGYYGNGYDVVSGEQFYSWSVFRDRVTLGNPGSQYIRFVRDIKP